MPTKDLLAEFSAKMAQKGKLFEATVELTHRCNLHCVHCYINHETLPQQSSVEQWKRAIDQLADMGLCMITFTGGEALLYKDTLALVRHAFLKGCQVRLFSNANLFISKEMVADFRRAGLCYFETSIYGASAAIHDQVTRVVGSFDRTIQAIKWAKEVGIAVTAKSSWLNVNWREYDGIRRLVQKLKIHFRGSPNVMIRIGGERENEKSRMSLDEMTVFFQMDRQQSMENDCLPADTITQSKRPCGIAVISLTFGPDGTVYPCVHLRAPIGNVFSDDIKDLWTNSPYLKKLRAMTTDDFVSCKGCSLKKYCFVCMGDGWVEWGDPLKPSSETCMMASARQAAEQLEVGKR